MDTMSIIDKYTPKNTKDIVANYKTIKDLKNFLQTYEIQQKNKVEKYDKMLLLLGPMASCKTSLCQCVFSDLNYTPIDIDITNLSGTIKQSIFTKIENKTLDDFFTKKKRVLFLDDVDLLSQYEKGLLTYIINLMATINIPIVCTCNKIDEKKIIEIKKKAKILYVNKVGYKECYQFVNKIIDTENLSVDYEILIKLIKDSKNDIKTVLFNLESCLTKNNYFKNNVESSKDPFYDMVVFDVFKKVYNNKLTPIEIEYILHFSYIMPLLLHENIIHEYKNYRNKTGAKYYKKVLTNYSNILQDYIVSDYFDALIRKNNDFSYNSNEITGYIKIITVNLHINQFNLNKNERKYSYCQLLSKNSLSYTFSKKKKSFMGLVMFNEYYFDLVIQIMIDTYNLMQYEDLPYLNSDVIEVISKYATVHNLTFSSNLKNQLKKKIK